jgi:two-component system phosphate regulon sensor histidine kinase PhoR
MTGRIFLKLILTFAALLAVAAVGFDYLATRALQRSLRADLERGLIEKARLAAAALRHHPRPHDPAAVRQIARAAGARLTRIDRQGRVLADSEADPAAMENHLSRPEFAEAMNGRTGVSVHLSRTLRVDFLYVAIPAPEGALRLAIPLTHIQSQTAALHARILTLTGLALIPAIFLAAWLARRVSGRLSRLMAFSQRIAGGDFAAAAPDTARDELGQLGSTLDATARKLRTMFDELQDERSRFAAAVNGIGEGILLASGDRRVILCNQALQRMFPREDLTPGAALDRWPQPEVLELFARVFETGAASAINLTAAEPVERIWKVSCAPVPNPSGKAAAAVAVFYDITELEKLERIRKDFVINVSHELRTPLASIQGYAETLLDGAIDDPANNRKFLTIIRQNAERLARLTADLMTLSRIELKAREFQFVPVAVDELLRQAADAIRSLTEKKGTTILLEPAPENLEVECDPESIHQVLMNLLDNAVKYTPEGGTVALGARPAGGEVEFSVRDTGIGIPEQEIPRLFERFYRVDLAIVKHLVRAHNGSVRVESQAGAGSTFFFRLPLVAPGGRQAAGAEALVAQD